MRQTDEKKRTWEQHLRQKQKDQEKRDVQRQQNGGEEKPWICTGCGKSSFRLRAEKGVLIRMCKTKGCNTEKVFK
ncbi:hypothetical protein [Priestia megaterium]|uniref:hypothetical protein n=1 Tax=Priestia megaterium TaxID=1404 RepID=UPI000BFE9275|nr:hypothetical protein [Priestia megaterium]PGQ88180.1 hypothetical protein COA18_04450 [Priestia megaterium]